MLPKTDKSKTEAHQLAEKKKIEIFDKSDSLNFTKKDLVDIIEPRVSEILDLVQKELNRFNC